MSAAVAQRNAHHLGPQLSSRTDSSMDNQHAAAKADDKSSRDAHKVKDASDAAAATTKSKNSKVSDSKGVITNADGAAPLAPPPKPSNNNNEGGDYFSGNHQQAASNSNNNNNNNNNEQNPFDSAFGNTSKLPETPGGTQLPPVASLTSPAGQLTGNSTGSFNWGNSLRSGPLSPAMLSGPAGGEDYFSTNVGLGRGFPTPNESSLRTGLTPGGGGSMFPPAQSPNTQALFSQLGGFQTPGTLEFQRTAQNANIKKEPFAQSQSSQAAAAATSQASTAAVDANTATAGAQNFDQHDAANGLFMLAQAGTESHLNQANQDKAKSRSANNNNSSVSNASDATAGRSSAPSEEVEQKPNTRNKGKKNNNNNASNAKNARKADEAPAKQPAKKKGKANNGLAQSANQFEQEPDSDENMDDDEMGLDGKDPKKMTDEEKRKNFLERNRVAALKCRQRKKQWLANLQAKVEIFTSENDALTAQVSQLREEILNLKTILIAHKDCPIAQQQSNMGHYIPTHHADYGAHNPGYNQYAPPGPQHMAGMANAPRRYS